MNYKDLAEKIIAMKNEDLRVRERLIEAKQLGHGYHQEMEQVHNRNADRLNKIMDEIGYPILDKVGPEASEAAWLIIQHAIGKPAFMKKCVKRLKIAVSNNQASPQNLAYLTDRIAAFEGKPQRYGTSFDWDDHGEMSPNPFDDLTKVNQRRKAIGLNTLEEQIEIMRRQVRRENQVPPKDLEKRKRHYNEWRKTVGWIQ